MILCLRDSMSTGEMLGGAGRLARASIVSVVKRLPSVADVSNNKREKERAGLICYSLC